MIGPVVLEREVCWEGRYLRSLMIRYRSRKGDIIEWEAFQRIGVKGIVAIVPFTREGEVVLIRQFRPPVNRFVVEFPAGLNDMEESLEEVALRELYEETGYASGRLEPVAEGPLSSGASTEILTVFVATDCFLKGGQQLDEVEDIEVLKLPFNGFHKRLTELQDKETLVDLKIYGLFELARRRAGL